jgi:hypothetical protein
LSGRYSDANNYYTVRANALEENVLLQLFDVEDSSFRLSAGVGAWTKTDSVTDFDDLVVAVRC